MVLIAPIDPAQMVMFCALATQVAKALPQPSDSDLAGKPCVCNNGQRDAVRNPGFTGNGITCNTLEPCMLNKIGDNQMHSSFTFSSPSCSLQTCVTLALQMKAAWQIACLNARRSSAPI
jgi:hypothetical protein